LKCLVSEIDPATARGGGWKWLRIVPNGGLHVPHSCVMLHYVILCYVISEYCNSVCETDQQTKFDHVTWVPLTAACRVLGLRMEETAFRYGE
jgi:hypothetical protein